MRKRQFSEVEWLRGDPLHRSRRLPNESLVSPFIHETGSCCWSEYLMVIKSERGVYGYFVILLLIIVFLVFLYLSMGASFLFSVLYQIPLMILSFLYFISIGRILYFDEKGCTIQLLRYKKAIPWNCLKYIQVETYPGRNTYRSPL